MSTQETKYVQVYKMHSPKAGYYYSNVVRKSVKIFDMEGTYQEGNTMGVGRLNWFLKDKHLQASGEQLPDTAWGLVEGGIISDDEYQSILKGNLGVDVSASTSDDSSETASAV